MAKSRDVIVLGWWASVQNRIDYAALLRRELRVGLAEAKAKLESSLETPVVLSIAPAERDRGGTARRTRKFAHLARVTVAVRQRLAVGRHAPRSDTDVISRSPHWHPACCLLHEPS
jgi:hypothetical protein